MGERKESIPGWGYNVSEGMEGVRDRDVGGAKTFGGVGE